MYFIQQCFICCPFDSTVSEDAGIEPRTAATFALACKHSNNSARSHSHSARSHPQSARSHPQSARSHPQTWPDLIHTVAHTDRMVFKNVREDGTPILSFNQNTLHKFKVAVLKNNRTKNPHPYPLCTLLFHSCVTSSQIHIPWLGG